MIDKFGQAELRQAFAALGERLHGRTEIVLGGAGALILTGDPQRATSECDVLYSSPDIGRLQEDIRTVAKRLGLTSGWLNGSVQSYLGFSPSRLPLASALAADARQPSRLCSPPTRRHRDEGVRRSFT